MRTGQIAPQLLLLGFTQAGLLRMARSEPTSFITQVVPESAFGDLPSSSSAPSASTSSSTLAPLSIPPSTATKTPLPELSEEPTPVVTPTTFVPTTLLTSTIYSSTLPELSDPESSSSPGVSTALAPEALLGTDEAFSGSSSVLQPLSLDPISETLPSLPPYVQADDITTTLVGPTETASPTSLANEVSGTSTLTTLDDMPVMTLGYNSTTTSESVSLPTPDVSPTSTLNGSSPLTLGESRPTTFVGDSSATTPGEGSATTSDNSTTATSSDSLNTSPVDNSHTTVSEISLASLDDGPVMTQGEASLTAPDSSTMTDSYDGLFSTPHADSLAIETDISSQERTSSVDGTLSPTVAGDREIPDATSSGSLSDEPETISYASEAGDSTRTSIISTTDFEFSTSAPSADPASSYPLLSTTETESASSTVSTPFMPRESSSSSSTEMAATPSANGPASLTLDGDLSPSTDELPLSTSNVPETSSSSADSTKSSSSGLEAAPTSSPSGTSISSPTSTSLEASEASASRITTSPSGLESTTSSFPFFGTSEAGQPASSSSSGSVSRTGISVDSLTTPVDQPAESSAFEASPVSTDTSSLMTLTIDTSTGVDGLLTIEAPNGDTLTVSLPVTEPSDLNSLSILPTFSVSSPAPDDVILMTSSATEASSPSASTKSGPRISFPSPTIIGPSSTLETSLGLATTSPSDQVDSTSMAQSDESDSSTSSSSSKGSRLKLTFPGPPGTSRSSYSPGVDTTTSSSEASSSSSRSMFRQSFPVPSGTSGTSSSSRFRPQFPTPPGTTPERSSSTSFSSSSTGVDNRLTFPAPPSSSSSTSAFRQSFPIPAGTSSTSSQFRPTFPTPTGTPNANVPTPNSALAPTTGSISEAQLRDNVREAAALNDIFRQLTDNSACTNGQTACIYGNIGTCKDGVFIVTECPGESKCYALPMTTTKGVGMECASQAKAMKLLGDSYRPPREPPFVAPSGEGGPPPPMHGVPQKPTPVPVTPSQKTDEMPAKTDPPTKGEPDASVIPDVLLRPPPASSASKEAPPPIAGTATKEPLPMPTHQDGSGQQEQPQGQQPPPAGPKQAPKPTKPPIDTTPVDSVEDIDVGDLPADLASEVTGVPRPRPTTSSGFSPSPGGHSPEDALDIESSDTFRPPKPKTAPGSGSGSASADSDVNAAVPKPKGGDVVALDSTLPKGFDPDTDSLPPELEAELLGLEAEDIEALAGPAALKGADQGAFITRTVRETTTHTVEVTKTVHDTIIVTTTEFVPTATGTVTVTAKVKRGD